jgi:hypothetical protein
MALTINPRLESNETRKTKAFSSTFCDVVHNGHLDTPANVGNKNVKNRTGTR